jgi:hypothetical protein
VARQIGRAAGGPLKRLTLELGGKSEPAGRRTARACALVNPALKVRNGMRGLPAHECPFAPEHSLRRAIVALRHRAHYRADRRLLAVSVGQVQSLSVI